MKQIAVTSDMLKRLEALPDARPGSTALVWTKEMDEVMRKGWRVKRKVDVAKVLGLNETTCRKRAEVLGL